MEHPELVPIWVAGNADRALLVCHSVSSSPNIYFFKHLFIFIGKSNISRGVETEKIFCPMVHIPSDRMAEARSQEPLPGLPHGCRVPRPWAVLDRFPRPQAGSWMGSGAARIRTGVRMGSQRGQGENFSC